MMIAVRLSAVQSLIASSLSSNVKWATLPMRVASASRSATYEVPDSVDRINDTRLPLGIALAPYTEAPTTSVSRRAPWVNLPERVSNRAIQYAHDPPKAQSA